MDAPIMARLSTVSSPQPGMNGIFRYAAKSARPVI